MGLFSYQDIKKAAAPEKGAIKKLATGNTSHVIAKHSRQLSQLADNLEQESTYQYSTAGAWSLHEIICVLSKKIGPARLFLTTWTITEEPMRVLFQLIQDGLIEELNCIFDYRIEKRKAEAFQLAKVNSSRIKLTKIHAKVAVLVNDQWAVTILGSANLTKNPRIEAGFISTCRQTADFHIAWILNEIENGDTFKK